MIDSEAVWKALDTYKELITNGLDLLSFLFVTSELIRIARPTVTIALPIVIGIASMLFWITPLLSLIDAKFGRTVLILFCGGLFLALIVRGGYKFSKKSPPFFRWLSEHIFYVGIVLFFVSRLFAFTVATHNALNAP
jgi:hypothetical protein